MRYVQTMVYLYPSHNNVPDTHPVPWSRDENITFPSNASRIPNPQESCLISRNCLVPINNIPHNIPSRATLMTQTAPAPQSKK